MRENVAPPSPPPPPHCREHDHGQDGHYVLHDEEPDGYPPVKGIDLLLVRKELDYDNGTGEREGNRYVE